MSTLTIIVIALIVVFSIIFFINYISKISREEEAQRMPNPDEVSIVKDDESYIPHKGDFYIRDSREDPNPFERFDVYRIEDVRNNVFGHPWVKYTAPGYDSYGEPKWRIIEAPLETFAADKVRVEKIKVRVEKI